MTFKSMTKSNFILLILVLAFLMIPSVHSQEIEDQKEDNRLTVGVVPFLTKDIRKEKFSLVLKEQVLNALNTQNRFQLIDIDREGRKLIIDIQSVRSKIWIEDNTINPKYTLTGLLSSVKFIRINGQGYKATINYTIKIADTETGEIINKGTATFSSSESEIRITPESAFLNAVEKTVPELNAYFVKSFPIEVPLARIEKSKKNKALEVIIRGGSKFGVEEKMAFETYYIDESLGDPLPKFFGQVEVIKVLNENFSLAKVTKGQKEVFKYFESNQRIICKSIQ